MKYNSEYIEDRVATVMVKFNDNSTYAYQGRPLIQFFNIADEEIIEKVKKLLQTEDKLLQTESELLEAERIVMEEMKRLCLNDMVEVLKNKWIRVSSEIYNINEIQKIYVRILSKEEFNIAVS